MHAALDRLLLNQVDVGILADQFPDAVGNDQQFENPRAAAVAGAAAVAAGRRRYALLLGFAGAVLVVGRPVEVFDLVDRQVGLAQHVGVGLVTYLALGAEDAHQALAQDGADGAGHRRRLHAQVEQADQGRHRVVGVQGREDHVAGLGRLAGDLGRLLIADLADHDHVGVLPQDAAQLRGEGLARLDVDLDLRHVGHLALDRVLDGDDVLLKAVDLVEAGIQRGALAGAGGAADDEHAVRLGDDLVDLLVHALAHADLGQAHDLLAAVEDTHDQLLARDAAGGGHAEVDLPAVGLGREAAVLGLALLNDVH